MNYALAFRAVVRDELDEAYRWYESQKPGLGNEFLDCIDEVLNRIGGMPEAYPVVYRDVRRAVVKRFPYAIYSRMRNSECGVRNEKTYCVLISEILADLT
ncbi:MAG: type II toxin-antitoxin system RelE/ParE family toxin [Cyanobacteria bacterium P01_H01_bin.162]